MADQEGFELSGCVSPNIVLAFAEEADQLSSRIVGQ